MKKLLRALFLGACLLQGAIGCAAEEKPSGTDKLIAELRKAIESRDLKLILGTYDFSEVHQIHQDQEFLDWKGYFEFIGEAKIIDVFFVPLKSAPAKDRDWAKNGDRVGDRHYRPNVPVAGLIYIECAEANFVRNAGLTKKGQLRLSSIAVDRLKK